MFGAGKLDIMFCHWDKSFLSTNKHLQYKAKNGLNIYSFDVGEIDMSREIPSGIFNVPDEKHFKHTMVINHDFKTNKRRKDYLKQLWIGLHEFGNNWEGFKNKDTYPNKKIFLNGEFWIM